MLSLSCSYAVTPRKLCVLFFLSFIQISWLAGFSATFFLVDPFVNSLQCNKIRWLLDSPFGPKDTGCFAWGTTNIRPNMAIINRFLMSTTSPRFLKSVLAWNKLWRLLDGQKTNGDFFWHQTACYRYVWGSARFPLWRLQHSTTTHSWMSMAWRQPPVLPDSIWST